MNPGEPRNTGANEPEEIVHFCLYIAGNSPNSRRAVANLQQICTRYLPNRSQVEVVDVWLAPSQAFAAGIWVTPTLQRLHPQPEVRIMGDLSDTSAVLLALGLADSA